MTRKRSKYRPKTNLVDPLNWVLVGLKPVASATETITLLRAMNHGAILAATTGKATIDDADALLGALNMAEALARLGPGADWLPEIAQAQQALQNAGNRPRFGFTGPEMEILNTVMAVHDLQLDNPATTVGLVDKARAMVQKSIFLKKTRSVRFPVNP